MVFCAALASVTSEELLEMVNYLECLDYSAELLHT